MSKKLRKEYSLDGVILHLLHRASQRADDLFSKEVGEIGLTPRQFAVLLAAAQSEAPTQTDIVDWTGIDRSTVAQMMPRMVKKGLLQRRRSRQDARAIIVRLTETGRNTLRATQLLAERSGTALLTSLSGEQRKAFVEALRAIANS